MVPSRTIFIRKNAFSFLTLVVEHTINLNSSELTMSSIENPLVHLINTPDEADVCLTGKENVNPSSLLLAATWSGSLAFSTNCFSDEAIKSKRSYKQETWIGKWHIKRQPISKSTAKVYGRNEITSRVPVIKRWGIGCRSTSCSKLRDLWPPRWTLKTLKLVPPRSRA